MEKKTNLQQEHWTHGAFLRFLKLYYVERENDWER
jgi:hypothetical protein